MKRKKNKAGLFFILSLVLIIGFSILVNHFLPNEEIEFNNISYGKYKELLTSEDFKIVYVGRDGCNACKMFIPILSKIQKEYSITINYLNTDTMTSDDFTDIATTSSVFAGQWGTPTLVAIKNGEIVSTKSGYAEYNEIQQFVVSAMSEKVEFNDISYEQYKEILTSDELKIVYVGRDGCGYCQMLVPILGQIQDKYLFKFNYLNTDTMTSDDFADISTTADVFAGQWGTPTLVAIKNGKVISSRSGYAEYNIIEEFVKNLLYN